MTKVCGELLGRVQMSCATAGLISYLSISYLLAKLSEPDSPKCVLFIFIKRIVKRRIRAEKIELELITIDIAIGYLGALILFAICLYEKYHVYCPQGGYFLVEYKFMNQY